MKIKVSRKEIVKYVDMYITDRKGQVYYLIPDFIEVEAEPVEGDAVKNGYMGKFLGYVPDIPDHPTLPKELKLPTVMPPRYKQDAAFGEFVGEMALKIQEIIRYLKARE